MIFLIIPFMFLLPAKQDWVSARDLAGIYVLLASFDINFAIRDLLRNRNLAAMITWTEVVFYSMLDFLKVCNFMQSLIMFYLYAKSGLGKNGEINCYRDFLNQSIVLVAQCLSHPRLRVGKKFWNFQRQGGNGKFSEAGEEFFRGGNQILLHRAGEELKIALQK